MHLLYCDESNLEERAGDFLLYAGISVDTEHAIALSQAIDRIRSNAAIDRSFKLKFNPSPDTLAHEDFVALKQSIVQEAVQHGVKLLCYAILHDIARSPDEARRNGINTVCYHFDCLLHRLRSPGLVLIDRFNDAGNQVDAHLSDKFAIGVTGLPFSREYRLRNIVGFHYSSIGQSHFPTVIDIILGSLRFAINAHTRNDHARLETARRLLTILSPLFHRDAEDGPVSELGFLLSPKGFIRSDGYRNRYQALKAFLGSAGVEIAQEIATV